MYIDELGAGIQTDLIAAMIRRGQAFGATSGLMQVASVQNVAAVIFNPPNSGKNVYVYGIQVLAAGSAAQMGKLAHITADPGWTPVAAILNKNRGSLNSAVAVVEYNLNVPTGPAAAVTTDTVQVSSGTELQYFEELDDTLLPPGTGIEVWLPLTTAGGAAAVNFDWYEY
jgi:hypothetical protein